MKNDFIQKAKEHQNNLKLYFYIYSYEPILTSTGTLGKNSVKTVYLTSE